MANIPYVRSRRGRYLVQVRVPEDLVAHYGKRMAEKSLRTASPTEARRLSHAEVAKIKTEFDRVRAHRRRGTIAPEDVAHVADAEARRLYQEFATDPDLYPDPAKDIDLGVTRVRLEEALSRGVPDDRDRQRAAALVRELGLEPNDATVEAVHKAVTKASLRAVVALTHGRELPAPAAPSKRLADAAKQFLADREADKGVAAKTIREYRRTLDLLQAAVGDVPLAGISRSNAADFLRGLGGVSAGTVNKHVTALMQLWKWAGRTGVLSEDHRSPWTGQHRRVAGSKTVGWLPFGVDELNVLIERPEAQPARHSLVTARAWIVLVGLFSGMRLGEICGLEVGDIKEADGVPFFDLTAAKSEAGIRRVPVHSVLIDLGFLTYVKYVRKGSLWPGLKPGGPDDSQAYTMSKAFIRWRKSRDVERPRVAFHSLRKNVVESLERARVHQSEVAQVVGHEKGFTFSVYSPHGLGIAGLRDVVEQVAYPGLKLPG